MKKYVLGFVLGAAVMFGIQVFATIAFIPPFKDEGTFADWFKNSVASMHASQVMNGYPDGTFKPANTVTRAELAVILDKYTQNIVNTKINMEDSKLTRYFGLLQGLTLGSPIVTFTEAVDLANVGVLRLNSQPDITNYFSQNTDSTEWEMHVERSSSMHFYLHSKPTDTWYGPFTTLITPAI